MPRVLVLCYHAVSEAWPAATSVKPEHFEAQLESLVRAGWRGATLRDALTSPPHELTLAVTFDDAHRSVLELAYPVLARLGIPASVFVPTDYPGSGRPMAWDGYDTWIGGPHEAELLCLSWDELRGLRDEGWEIGAHTCSHPRLTAVSDEQLARELAGSRERCEEEMCERCLSLAYPYGDHDERVVAAARDAGYAFACTVPRRAAEPLPLRWPRVGVYHGEGAGELQLRIARRARSVRGLAPAHLAAGAAARLRRARRG